MKSPQQDPQRSQIRDKLPPWETVVMAVVLFSVWWLGNKLFPGRGIGKLLGIVAAIATLALIIWAHVWKQKVAKRRMKDRYQRRIDALKADGIPVTHKNMYDNSIRPDVPVDPQQK